MVFCHVLGYDQGSSASRWPRWVVSSPKLASRWWISAPGVSRWEMSDFFALEVGDKTYIYSLYPVIM